MENLFDRYNALYDEILYYDTNRHLRYNRERYFSLTYTRFDRNRSDHMWDRYEIQNLFFQIVYKLLVYDSNQRTRIRCSLCGGDDGIWGNPYTTLHITQCEECRNTKPTSAGGKVNTHSVKDCPKGTKLVAVNHNKSMYAIFERWKRAQESEKKRRKVIQAVIALCNDIYGGIENVSDDKLYHIYNLLAGNNK